MSGAAACRARLARDPDDVAALQGLGFALLAEGRAVEAVAMLADVAVRQPTAETLNDLGGMLRAVGLAAEAEARFRDALATDPAHAQAWCNLGMLLAGQGRVTEALPALRQAVELRPDLPVARHALSEALLACGNDALARDEVEAAEALYREAIGERPDFAAALNNLGNALMAQNRLAEAVTAYRTARALQPDSADTAFALSLALLAQGTMDQGSKDKGTRDNGAVDKRGMGQGATNERVRDEPATGEGAWDEGWALFEARRRVAALAANFQRRPGLEQWQPDTLLEDRRVLLMSEQGRGDIIQYIRYAPLLAEAGSGAAGIDVVLELPDDLRPLFDTMPGVIRTVGLDEPAPDCDLACPLLSLPLIFGTTPGSIPATIPYARVPPDRLARWHALLGPAKARRVGLVCSGDVRHPYDHRRSIALERLAPLLAQPDMEFLLLQPDLREGDRLAAAAMPWLRWPGTALRDYADTAAAMAQTELVIAVDTSAAHLAGALGLPVWLLLPYSSDARWGLSQHTSAWYPTMRLFRQSRPGGWDDVIETVRRELAGRT